MKMTYVYELQRSYITKESIQVEYLINHILFIHLFSAGRKRLIYTKVRKLTFS